MNEERPIESLLRRYAQQRRQAARQELHPATRRLLQAEVARQFPKARPTPGLWTWLRARWVYAAACLLAVAVSGWWLRSWLQPRHGVTTLAYQNEPAAAAPRQLQLANAEFVASNAPAHAAAPGAAVPFAEARDGAGLSRVKPEGGAGFAGEPVASHLEAPPASPLVATAKMEKELKATAGLPVPAQAAEVQALADSRVDSLAVAPIGAAAKSPGTLAAADRALPAAAAPRASTVLQGAGVGAKAAAGFSQSFAQSLAKPTPAVRVLSHFQVEQSENRLRVIDGDGSVYLGVVADEPVSVSDVVESEQPKSRRQARRTFASAPAPAAFRYLVRGTNLTLQQPVSFSWNFVAASNAARVAGLVPAALPAPAWSNAVIAGQVQIDRGPRVDFQAVPVPR